MYRGLFIRSMVALAGPSPFHMRSKDNIGTIWLVAYLIDEKAHSDDTTRHGGLPLVLDVREVNRDTLEPILFLLQSPDIEVQRAASAALGNLAVNGIYNFLQVHHCLFLPLMPLSRK